MKKNILMVLLIVMCATTVFAIYAFVTITKNNNNNLSAKPDNLSSEERLETIRTLRDQGIKDAVAKGDYRCCIEPPCTMCYMEGNKWNNNTPGTCACDDLIAQGKEACPQCRRGLEAIHSEENTYCDIDSAASKCNSTKN